jgi:hypothetical protein
MLVFFFLHTWPTWPSLIPTHSGTHISLTCFHLLYVLNIFVTFSHFPHIPLMHKDTIPNVLLLCLSCTSPLQYPILPSTSSSWSTLKMEAASASEALVSIYQTTWRNFPEKWNLHQHYCEKVKSYTCGNSLQEKEMILP